MEQATDAVELIEAQRMRHKVHARYLHPEIPKRLSWLEREMTKLADGLDNTRRDLDKAMGQDWKDIEPSWDSEASLSDSLASQSFPRDLDLSRDTPAQPYQPARGPHIERDFGPDVGMGL